MTSKCNLFNFFLIQKATENNSAINEQTRLLCFLSKNMFSRKEEKKKTNRHNKPKNDFLRKREKRLLLITIKRGFEKKKRRKKKVTLKPLHALSKT